MPVSLTVSDIRNEIYRASGFASGDGEASTCLLGSLFHGAFHEVMKLDAPCGWTNILDHDNLNDWERLRSEIYDNFLGARLRKHEGELQQSAAEVLALWEAVEQLARHICQLLTNSLQQKVLRYDFATNQWRGADQFATEQQLTWTVEDAAWTAPVVVSGIADAVWRNPVSKSWCILELKLGSGSKDSDLAQLCLYHEMLRAKSDGPKGAISLWHFQPALNRTTFSEEQIEPVKSKLHALIGRLAGVVPNPQGEDKQAEYKLLGKQLVTVLHQFGPMVSLESDPVVGPAFLRFHIRPGPGVKVKKILSLGDDVGVQLRLPTAAIIRLEDGMLVVDLQRPDRQKLLFSEFRPVLPNSESGNSKLLVGIDLHRQPKYLDLSSDSPHTLAAGTAGSGKSEWLRMALASLLVTNTPKTLRIMLIDPKRVAFGELSGSAYLLDSNRTTRGAFLHTPEEAIGGLQRLIDVMEERYALFAEHKVTDLDALNKKGRSAVPRIVCFCDEYGNLVAQKKARDAIELSINQLGAKARAAGIHLILATQDPRAQIVSPTLKTNLSGRVCLRTTSGIQSRMMLEQNGAESLLGHGDLFFRTIGEPVRLQAPLLTDIERHEIYTQFLTRQ